MSRFNGREGRNYEGSTYQRVVSNYKSKTRDKESGGLDLLGDHGLDNVHSGDL